MYHALGAGAPSEQVASLYAAADAALATPQRSLTVGLDAVDRIDSELLPALIVVLRRFRSVGGKLALHVTRDDLRRTFEVTGLERVFTIIAAPQASPAVASVPTIKAPRRKSLADGIAGLIAGFLVLAASTLAAFAQGGAPVEPEMTPQYVIEKIVERNPSLNSFEAHVDVRLHTGIPFLNPTLEGTTYFKRPDNYEVIFTKVPSYAHGIQSLYSDIGDPSGWEKRFVLSRAGEETFKGHHDLVIRLVQRVRGMIDHEDVLVDPQAWTVDKLTYHYYNGGIITLEQTFRQEGGYDVLSDQRATIALPNIPRVIGSAHYSGYHMNVAIDDAVFTLKQTKELGTGGK